MLFVIPYFFLTQYTIHQFYISGFVFLLPLGIMTVMYKRISVYGLYWKTVALSVLGTIFTFLIFWNYDGTASITNSDLYERIICSGRIPQNLTDNIFPNRIPLDATEIELSYSPKMLGQSGLQFALSFSAPESVIEDYVREFLQDATWTGSPLDAVSLQAGIFSHFYVLDFKESGLPNDYTIYVLYGETAYSDWNHGECTLAATSPDLKSVLFLAEKW